MGVKHSKKDSPGSWDTDGAKIWGMNHIEFADYLKGNQLDWEMNQRTDNALVIRMSNICDNDTLTDDFVDRVLLSFFTQPVIDRIMRSEQSNMMNAVMRKVSVIRHPKAVDYLFTKYGSSFEVDQVRLGWGLAKDGDSATKLKEYGIDVNGLCPHGQSLATYILVNPKIKDHEKVIENLQVPLTYTDSAGTVLCNGTLGTTKSPERILELRLWLLPQVTDEIVRNYLSRIVDHSTAKIIIYRDITFLSHVAQRIPLKEWNWIAWHRSHLIIALMKHLPTNETISLVRDFVNEYGYPELKCLCFVNRFKSKVRDDMTEAEVRMLVDSECGLRKKKQIIVAEKGNIWCQQCARELEKIVIVPCGCTSQYCMECLDLDATCDCGWSIVNVVVMPKKTLASDLTVEV